MNKLGKTNRHKTQPNSRSTPEVEGGPELPPSASMIREELIVKVLRVGRSEAEVLGCIEGS